MTKCYQRTFEFPRVNRCVVEANFAGGDITTDGGVLLLRQADRLLGLSDAISQALSDPRRQASVWRIPNLPHKTVQNPNLVLLALIVTMAAQCVI